jgi:hypothetical protein
MAGGDSVELEREEWGPVPAEKFGIGVGDINNDHKSDS